MFGQGLSQLAGVDVALVWVQNAAQNALIRFPEGMHFFDLGRG